MPWLRRDTVVLAGLLMLALALRLAWFSGYGLGDDPILLGFVRRIAVDGVIPADNMTYRFTWWLPSVISYRLLRGREISFVLPSLLASIGGIAVVYLLGRKLWGRRGGTVAALLLVVLPLDFAWSTMMTSDILVSVFSGAALLCVLSALAEGARMRAPLWAGAGLSLWLAFHAKLTALALVPVIAYACWRHRRQLDGQMLWMIAVAGILFGGTVATSYALAGDPIAPLHAEVAFQGLPAPDAIRQHALTREIFWTWRDVLFLRDNLGDLLFSVYPHALVVLAVACALRGAGARPELVAWLVVVLLGLQFGSIRRVDGVFVASFRNVRHAHVLAYPLVLLLTGYLLTLRRWRPVIADAAVVVLLAAGAWSSISAAAKTHACFGDQRAAAQYLLSLLPRPVHCDFHFAVWFQNRFTQPDPSRKVYTLPTNAEERRATLDYYRYGYLVTGGGREPYYGCHTCIVRAEELPPGRFRLLREFPGPKTPTSWRPEPLRVWEGVPLP